MLGFETLAGKALYGVGCVVAAVVMLVSGVAYYGTRAVNSLGTSPNLSGGPSTGPMNILIMGLESRTYWDGTSVDHHIGDRHAHRDGRRTATAGTRPTR